MPEMKVSSWLVTVSNSVKDDALRVFTVNEPDIVSAIVAARKRAVETGYAMEWPYAQVVAVNRDRV